MLRYAAAQDQLQVRALWEQGFGSEEPYTGWYFSNVYRSERTLVYEEDGKLYSSLQLAPYTLSLRGRELPAAYIVGVVTEQAAQGRGYASALIRRALNDLGKEGRELALLYTDIPGFYQPLGFTCCYSLRQLHFPASSGSSVGFEKITPTADNLTRCQEVYRRMCRHLDGYVIRTVSSWQTYVGDWLSDERNGLYLGPEAYILTDIAETGFAVKEIGYADEKALRQALNYCGVLAAASGYPEFYWDAPESAPLPRQKGEALRPWVMARICGKGGLSAAAAAAATRHFLDAPDPRLWVGEIT